MLFLYIKSDSDPDFGHIMDEIRTLKLKGIPPVKAIRRVLNDNEEYISDILDGCKDNDDKSIWCQLAEHGYGSIMKTFPLILELFDTFEYDSIIQTIVCDVISTIQDEFTNLLDGSCNYTILEALDQTMKEHKKYILSKLNATKDEIKELIINDQMIRDCI